MAREIAISIYLAFFRLIFNICKLFPQKKKTVCIASFGDNIHYSTKALRSLSNQEIIYLQDRSCSYPFDSSIGPIIPFTLLHPIAYCRSIYHLATATTILADNYFGFLAVTHFKRNTHCIQLWHAVGSLKQFGLMDPSNQNRSKRAMKRFKRVYNVFDYTITGSDKMATIFRESFGLTNDHIKRTGIPRTDIFYNGKKISRIQQDMYQLFPVIKNKKVILYAPTFRKKQAPSHAFALNTAKLQEAFGNDYIVLIKQHPADPLPVASTIDGFAYDVSDYYEINHLLLITDILITDYSSIPFEFAIMHKPMVFFDYDMEKYKKEQGISSVYTEKMPGPIVYTTEEIISAIQKQDFQIHDIAAFAEKWNVYSNGQSSKHVAEMIHHMEYPALSEQIN